MVERLETHADAHAWAATGVLGMRDTHGGGVCPGFDPLLSPDPRVFQGAFADTVRMLYAKRFGTSEPEVTVFGKPTGATFGYAREVLEKRRESMGLRAELERIYMIGGECRKG